MSNLEIGKDICLALGLNPARVVELKIEVTTDGTFVTAVQYLNKSSFCPVNKVLSKYQLKLLEQTPVATPDAEVFADGRVHTFHLPANSLESPST